MIGEVKMNALKRRYGPLVWRFFQKLNNKHARCEICHGLYNYQNTSSHLLKHVRNKHSEAYWEIKNQNGSMEKEKNSVPTNELSSISWPAVEVLVQTDESKSGEKSGDEEQSPDVWSLFTKIEDGLAECNLCQIKLPCKDSIAELTEHRENKHSGVLLKGSEHGSPQKEAGMRMKRSQAWQYFTLLDKVYAQCKFCQMVLNHASISNLMRHAIRKHPLEIIARTRSGGGKDDEKDEDDNSVCDPDAVEELPDNKSTISDAEVIEDSGEETSEDANETKKESSPSPESEQTSRPRRSKRIKTDDCICEGSPTKDIVLYDDSVNDSLKSPQDQKSVLKDDTPTDVRRRNRSTVWENFTKLENGCVQCRICDQTMSKTSNVSNLHRHMRRVHLGLSLAQSKTTGAKSATASFKGKRSGRHPIIHTFDRKTKRTSNQSYRETACSSSDSEQLSNVVGDRESRKSALDRVLQRIGKSQTADTSSRPTGCLLSERLVLAVEEGNQLLRSLQSTVEKQTEAISRLVACLEGKNQVQEDKVANDEVNDP